MLAYAVLALVALVAFVSIASWLSRIKSLEITNVTVVGASVIDEKKLSEFTMRILEGNRFGFLSRKNIFLYPEKSLRLQVLTTFPRIKEVEIERDGLHVIELTIKERNPFALWCGDIVPVFDAPEIIEEPIATSSSRAGAASSTPATGNRQPVTREANLFGQCYLVDEEAYIFDRAPRTSETPFHRFYSAIAKGRVTGQQFASAAEFQTLHDFLQSIKQDGIETEALLLIDEEEMEIYMSEGPRVIIRRDGDFNEAQKNLQLIMNSGELQDKDLSQVEYVDLRFGNKVYFKEKATAN